jgi:conjugal transfer pilus assembly protein TraE
MFFKKYLSEKDNANHEIRFLRWLTIWMGAVILVQVVVMARLIGTEKIVLVPPEIKRSFWVSDNVVSKEYLEEMAYWYAGLALNITPITSDYQKNLFLTYAAPSEYGRLQAEMGVRAEFLRKNNTATQFVVRSITTDEKNQRVALSGYLHTWTSDKKAGERNTIFMIGFKQMNGKLYVSDFKETSEKDIFGDASAAGKP